MNSYSEFIARKSVLVSDVVLKPTETKYHFYLGLKGDVDQTFKYDVKLVLA